VNSSDSGGGAEQIALTLHREYLRRGHDAALAVACSHTGRAGIFELDHNANRGIWARSWRSVGEAFAPLDGRIRGAGRLRRTLPFVVGQPRRWWAVRRGREDFDFPATALLPEIGGKAADVLHGHNLHGGLTETLGYFDLRALPHLSCSFPLFLTLHDPWLLSGHCAYSLECERWLAGCGSCPDLSLYPAVPRDATAFNWRRKRDIYARSRLRVATPSRWLMSMAERSMLAAGVVEARVIHYGIDLTVFRPAEKADARRELGLPADTPIVMAAANGLRSSPFKDLPLLRAAITAVVDEPILLLAVGEEAPEERYGSAVVRFIPRQEQASLARYYQAADVFVHAARAEAFGLVIAEAMACGTPVVATAVGGIPEQVTDGETGLLVPPGDTRAFAEALRSLLANRERRRSMGRAAVEAARRFELSRMVDAYLGWYDDVLAEEKSRRTAA